mgnify:FL=1
MHQTCIICLKIKLIRSFRYVSTPNMGGRTLRLIGKKCNACRTAALLREPSGKALRTAIERGEIGYVQGTILLKKHTERRKQRNIIRKAKLSALMKKEHAKRRAQKERDDS